MALTNPFDDVLKRLLDDIFTNKGVNSPLSQGLPVEKPSFSNFSDKEFKDTFKIQIERMQNAIQQRIQGRSDVNDVQSPTSQFNAFQQLSNEKEPAPVFSPTPQAKPDPNAVAPIRAPRFRPNLPDHPFKAIKTAQAGPVTMTDAGPQGPTVASPIPPVRPHMARPELFRALIKVESNNDPNAVSEDDAIGLTQVTTETGAQPGFGMPTITRAELFDPVKNEAWGKMYYEKFLRRYDNDEQLALIAYNAGFTIADAWDGDMSSLNKETREYLQKIDKELGGGTGLADSKLGFASTGPETPPTAPSAVQAIPTPETPLVAPHAPSAGRAVAPARPQRPSPVKAPPLPPPPDFNLEVPTLAQGGTRRPIVPVLWQQAVAKFQQSRDPKDLASVPRSGLPAILALMGRVARRSHT